MDGYPYLYSEEDIRTKVVTAWLMNHGFGSSDISVEYSFEIRLGRKILSIDSEKPKNSSSQIFRPRADILVRGHDGKNLLIVEVKAPNEPIDDNVKEQGICYARLLRKGGIAPFVVLTNGYETKIYDSITEELINGTTISPQHPHVKAGFRVSVDDIAIRAEAIETFISLSPDNLIEFCRRQATYRMRFLKDEDPYSGKKYIPSLYIEREGAKEDLIKLLDEEKRRVVVVVGPPQVGKTNFICHTVEERLEQGQPCLFFPAIGMGRGLLEAICEDFEWILGDSSSAYHVIHHKLQRILNCTHQRLNIFIDGWNEADLALARAIDRESERLSGYNIACVISMTDVAASRLLKDEVGNPSHVADAVGIDISELPRIGKKPKELVSQAKAFEKVSTQWSRVLIGRYSHMEMQEAYHKYTEIFNVHVIGLESKEDIYTRQKPVSHKFIEDPFLLRIAMELFHGQVLPQVLEEPDLLEKSIELKSFRAIDLRNKCVPEILSPLANEIFLKGGPVRQSVAMRCWGLPVADEPPTGLFEAALLAKVYDDRNLPAVDFYYGRERDFIVACWARDWTSKFKNTHESITSELALSGKTSIGLEALRWFLRQPAYKEQLQLVASFFSLYDNLLIKETILSSIREFVGTNDNDLNWIQSIINKGVNDLDLHVRAETVEIIQVLSDKNGYEDVIGYDKEFISKLLEIEEADLIGSSLQEVFHYFHLETVGTDDEGSRISGILEDLLDHTSHFVRLAAAKILGGIAPDIFLNRLGQKIIFSNGDIPQSRIEEYASGVESAVNQYGEKYYGFMCPGYLESLKENAEFLGSEVLCEEYSRMYKLCSPIIAFYPTKAFSRRLLELLFELNPSKSISTAFEDSEVEIIAQINALRYQLSLPFDDIDIK